MTSPAAASTAVLTPEQLRQHWQGHRRLTRRLIEVFPEQELFRFAVGGMRHFGALALEIVGMAAPTVRGVATGEWPAFENATAGSRAELLRLWDQTTEEIDRLWPTIPARRFQEVDRAFGMWEGPGHWILLYVIDNEIHHRGQGYVYLRALGIEPPPFWER